MQSKIGLICALIGSDGSGKGTVVNSILSDRKDFIDNKTSLHWRPGVLPPLRKLINPRHNRREDIINPQSEKHKNQSKILSFARWAYYLLDYILGYFFKIFNLKRRGNFILFDRYYYDYFVDPVRYGFNLPLWIFKSVMFLIPKPDLTIYLDNEPEELYKRKKELPVSELKRQVEAWREFIPSLPNARIVTTDKPLEDVVNEVTRIVLERRAEMTRKILKIEPEASQYLWKSDITEYVALPSKKNCRWIIPTNSKLAKKAWDLYQPYSLKGKFYRNYQKYLGRISPFNTRKTISSDSLNSDKSQILKTNSLRYLERMIL
jgi:thymidylate kinase